MKYPIGMQSFDQIRQEGYAKPYLNDPRRVSCIGMNFSSETRTIAEWMVRCSLIASRPMNSRL